MSWWNITLSCYCSLDADFPSYNSFRNPEVSAFISPSAFSPGNRLVKREDKKGSLPPAISPQEPCITDAPRFISNPAFVQTFYRRLACCTSLCTSLYCHGNRKNMMMQIWRARREKRDQTPLSLRGWMRSELANLSVKLRDMQFERSARLKGVLKWKISNS